MQPARSALLVLLLPACLAGAGYSTRDQVTAAAREYNDGVRWGKYDQAALHISKDQRQRFLERHNALDDELEIADYELVSIEVDKSDKKHTRVSAYVDYTWTLKRVGLVEKTSTRQEWEERDGDWVMSREVRQKGAPLTLFEEPPRAGTTSRDK